jgi:hypothetical protein
MVMLDKVRERAAEFDLLHFNIDYFGPGASEGAMKDGAMKQGTTGTSSRPSAAGDASTSGAGTAAGPNNTGAAKETGAVQKGVNKQ